MMGEGVVLKVAAGKTETPIGCCGAPEEPGVRGLKWTRHLDDVEMVDIVVREDEMARDMEAVCRGSTPDRGPVLRAGRFEEEPSLSAHPDLNLITHPVLHPIQMNLCTVPHNPCGIRPWGHQGHFGIVGTDKVKGVLSGPLSIAKKGALPKCILTEIAVPIEPRQGCRMLDPMGVALKDQSGPGEEGQAAAFPQVEQGILEEEFAPRLDTEFASRVEDEGPIHHEAGPVGEGQFGCGKKVR